jgi:hypothetical protein
VELARKHTSWYTLEEALEKTKVICTREA